MQEEWDQEKKKARVRQFMNILEQLPRLCSPTICGTLSQPTTKNERTSRGADKFEWSLEQKAILSPANITTDTDATDDWQNVADLNQTWLQQESDVFFSQRTIAPSPVVTPSTRAISRPTPNRYQNFMFDERDEDEDMESSRDFSKDEDEENDDDDDDHNNDDTDIDMDDEDDEIDDIRKQFESSSSSEDDETDLDGNDENTDEDTDHDNNDCDKLEEDQDMDNLFFSPQPLRSSQTQQRVDIFSPETFVRVMEDENTLQSTPKTIGSQLTRTRTRTRTEMSD